MDVSKDNLDIGVLPTGETWRAPNNPKGVASLAKRLKKLAPELVVLEATGGLEKAALTAMVDKGLPALQLNPRQVRDFARAPGKLEKTDKIDSLVLARFAQVLKPGLRPIKDPETRELSEVVRRRCQILEMLTAEKNRLSSATESRPVLKDLKAHIQYWEKRLERVNRDLEKSIKENPEWEERSQRLQSVKGIGPVVSTVLIALLPELGCLNRKQIAKLCGVAPLNNDSGKKRGSRSVWGGRAPVIGKADDLPRQGPEARLSLSIGQDISAGSVPGQSHLEIPL